MKRLFLGSVALIALAAADPVTVEVDFELSDWGRK
jgi:hypothetical protein